jgi:hypothetical protein
MSFISSGCWNAFCAGFCAAAALVVSGDGVVLGVLAMGNLAIAIMLISGNRELAR